MRFAGWVPTVTGHLSFTTLGTGSYPSKPWKKVAGQKIWMMQRRDLLDVLLPYAEASYSVSSLREAIAKRVLRISGRFCFFIEGEIAQDGESLTGKIHLLHEIHDKDIYGRLKRWFGSYDTAEDVVAGAADAAIHTLEFILERPGRVELISNQAGEADFDPELELTVANQSFFFLKDIAHVHQHHHPTHDAITELSDISKDQSLWISETQHSLFRAIIRYKRFKNEKALFRASGILAYALSFDRAYGGQDSPAKEFHFDELEQSLSVSREEIRHFDQKRLSLTETIRSFFFAAFGLVAATGIFARLAGTEDLEVAESVVLVAAYVAGNPFQVIGITALLSIFWAFMTHRIDPADNRIARMVLRMLQGLDVAVTAVFFSVFTLLCAGLAVWLLN